MTNYIPFKLEDKDGNELLFVDPNNGVLYIGGRTNGIKIESGGVMSVIGSGNIPSGSATVPQNVLDSIDAKVDKVTGKSLVTDTEITKIHAAGSDNQDLSSFILTDDPRLSDARIPLTHTHPYEPANGNIQVHVGSAHAPVDAQKNSDITLAEINAKLTGLVTAHTHNGKVGIATKNINDVSGVQNIAHGLGRVPSIVRVKAHCVFAAALSEVCEGKYDGTNHAGLCLCLAEGTSTALIDNMYSSTTAELGFTPATGTNPFTGTNRQTGVITCDATNIIITWTKAGTVASNTVNIMWEVN